MKQSKIAFIGCGNMGRSLIGGLIANGHPSSLLSGADPEPSQREQTKQQFDIETLEDNVQAIHGADVVVLAVKPQTMETTISGLASELIKQSSLVISIAAGIRLSAMEKWLSADTPIIRVMPNTPSLIQAGAAALYANTAVSEEQKEQAEAMLRSVGLALWLEDESQMDAVTALSGSGPAYIFLIMEVMEKAASKLGLEQEQARLLTMETVFGAAKMAMESKFDAATLRQQVTSPGGTTEAALKVLIEQGGMEKLFEDALSAAQQRSIELANEFGKDLEG